MTSSHSETPGILTQESISLMAGRHSHGTQGILTLKNIRLATSSHSGTQGILTQESISLMAGRHSHGTQGILTLKNTRLRTEDTLIGHRAFLY